MPLSPEELTRYARHIVLRHVGGPGQQKLHAASVLIIGAGGLGAPLIQYLAASGIGRIGIVDDDTVSLSNLQRQVIHRTADIGRSKAERAAEAVGEINPHVAVDLLAERLTEANAASLVSGYDIIADGSDNFDTRYAVSDACFHAKKPLVTAAINEFDGSITTLRPFEAGPDGVPNPTYRCLFPQKPPPGLVPTCSEAGVLGALGGIVGAMQAMEVLREIIGFGQGLVGRLLLIDALNLGFETIAYAWDPANPLNGSASAQPATTPLPNTPALAEREANRA
jgi:molybdopterin-synthase adenylyltransferase